MGSIKVTKGKVKKVVVVKRFIFFSFLFISTIPNKYNTNVITLTN